MSFSKSISRSFFPLIGVALGSLSASATNSWCDAPRPGGCIKVPVNIQVPVTINVPVAKNEIDDFVPVTKKQVNDMWDLKNEIRGLLSKPGPVPREVIEEILEKHSYKSEVLPDISDKKTVPNSIDVTNPVTIPVSSPVSSPVAIPKKEVKELHKELQAELDKIRKKFNFDPESWLESKVKNIVAYYKEHGLKAVIISISGGVDSAAVAGIASRVKKAVNAIPDHPLNEANGGKFILIAQPINSTPEIQNRAYEVGEAFGFKVTTIDQSINWDNICTQINNKMPDTLTPFASSMLKSYMRTPVAFVFASSVRGIVWGTGNFDEDGVLRYYCKFGDGAVDLSIIHDLHKSQIFKLAKHLGVPNSILVAPPSADLAPGQTDEHELGLKYDLVELVVNYLYGYSEVEKKEFTDSLSPEAKDQFLNAVETVCRIEKSTRHKKDLNPFKIEGEKVYSVYNLVK